MLNEGVINSIPNGGGNKRLAQLGSRQSDLRQCRFSVACQPILILDDLYFAKLLCQNQGLQIKKLPEMDFLKVLLAHC